MQKSNLKAVDFFCSGGGMSYGMQQAGIKVLAGYFGCFHNYGRNYLAHA